jgi:anaerobic selenocysteine-containing dehydrogenase
MKQVSPARLTQPLLRKPGSERGAGEFEPISWERAYEMLDRAPGPHPRHRSEEVRAVHRARPDAGAHRPVRAPVRHAQLCGARRLLLGEHGRRHDLHDRRQLLGVRRPGPRSRQAVRDDRHRRRPPQQPDEDGAGKFKREGGRFISINPIRTGYSAIADEWMPIRRAPTARCSWRCCTSCSRRPHRPRVPGASPTRRSWWCWTKASAKACSPSIPSAAPGDGRHPHNKLAWDLASGSVVRAYPEGVQDGRAWRWRATTRCRRHARGASFQLLRERVADTTPEWAEDITGIPAERIRQLAREMGETALTRPSSCRSRGPMRGEAARDHQGQPVAFHAMRGLARIPTASRPCARWHPDERAGHHRPPGGFRHKAPYPRHIVPNYRAFNDPAMIKPNTPLNAAPLGFPEPRGAGRRRGRQPVRIDHAFSWEHPLSAHGLMHNVITNAVRGDPYRIDTLLIFMANMAWNSR